MEIRLAGPPYRLYALWTLSLVPFSVPQEPLAITVRVALPYYRFIAHSSPVLNLAPPRYCGRATGWVKGLGRSGLSLGIAFKGPEGIVLAADSRVTLTGQAQGGNVLVQAHYDNATKLLKVKDHDYVGAVTYGLGTLGNREPRTAHSYLPEFETELVKEAKAKALSVGEFRLSVKEFATRLGDFFQHQWSAANTPAGAEPMVFLVGGYNDGEAYGRVFEVSIPNSSAPVEKNANEFGITLGGQTEIAARLLGGYDRRLEALVGANVHLNAAQSTNFREKVLKALGMPIPYQFLPLQDSVDLAIFLIRTTATLQGFSAGVRGVGGAIDVATITRTEGFRAIQEKEIVGERFGF